MSGIPIDEAKRRIAEYMVLLPRARVGAGKGMERLLRDVEFSVVDADFLLDKMWKKGESSYTERHYEAFETALASYCEWVDLHSQLRWMVHGES